MTPTEINELYELQDQMESRLYTASIPKSFSMDEWLWVWSCDDCGCRLGLILEEKRDKCWDCRKETAFNPVEESE